MPDRIRKVNADTHTTTNVLVMNNLAANAQVKSINISTDGTVYACDFYNDCVYKVYENGTVQGVLFGKLGQTGNVDDTGLNGTSGNTARATGPIGIAIDHSNNIYFGSSTRAIRVGSPSGRLITFVGNPNVSGAVQVNANGLNAVIGGDTNGSGIAVDKNGTIYVADTANHKILKISSNGSVIVLAGNGTAGYGNGQGNAAIFNTPTDLCVDVNGNVYVTDQGNNRIRIINESGFVGTLAGAAAGFQDGTGNSALFNAPRRICIDQGANVLYVIDGPTNAAIRKVLPHGAVSTFMHYNAPIGHVGDICIDRSNNLYLLENNY